MTGEDLRTIFGHLGIMVHQDDRDYWHIIVDDYTIFLSNNDLEKMELADIQVYLTKRIVIGHRTGSFKKDITVH
jgi:hypothetical protein